MNVQLLHACIIRVSTFDGQANIRLARLDPHRVVLVDHPVDDLFRAEVVFLAAILREGIVASAIDGSRQHQRAERARGCEQESENLLVVATDRHRRAPRGGLRLVRARRMPTASSVETQSLCDRFTRVMPAIFFLATALGTGASRGSARRCHTAWS